MVNYRIIGIIKSFSPEELKKFTAYVDSPFFNSNKKIRALYKILRQYYPDFEKKSLTKENLFLKTFGNKKYNGKILDNHFSILLGLAVDFLGLINLKAQPLSFKRNILNEVANRGFNNLFIRNYNIASGILDNSKSAFSKHEYFYNKFLLDEELARYYVNLNSAKPHHFFDIGENNIIAHLIILSQCAFNLFVSRHTFKQEIENNIFYVYLNQINFDNLIRLCKNYRYALFIRVYIYLIKLFTDSGKPAYFFTLKELISKNHNLFNRGDLFGIYASLHGYAHYRILNGDINFEKERYEITKAVIEHNAYSYSGMEFLPLVLFRNIILLSSDFNETDYAENFVKKYTDMLSPEYRSGMRLYGQAFVDFSRGNFQNSLKNISKVQNEILVIKYDVKNLSLMCYFELGWIDNANENIDSYRHLLANENQLTHERKEWFYNFLNSVNKLIKLKENKEKDTGYAINTLKKELEANQNMVFRTWIEKKINEIMKINNR